MNASLIHLASIECWQRARALGLTPNGYLILQAVAACTSAKGIRRIALLRELKLSGRELMTPQARPRDAGTPACNSDLERSAP